MQTNDPRQSYEQTEEQFKNQQNQGIDFRKYSVQEESPQTHTKKQSPVRDSIGSSRSSMRKIYGKLTENQK